MLEIVSQAFQPQSKKGARQRSTADSENAHPGPAASQAQPAINAPAPPQRHRLKLASLPMPRCAFYGLFIVSGFAGLIYESIWAHYLKLFLGHAAYAQSLVLAVFMGGMAVGAAAAARFSERLANPLLVYARGEACVGRLPLGFHSLFVALTDWSYAWLLPSLGNQALVLAG